MTKILETLGANALIAIGATDLEKSIALYKKIGFEKVGEGKEPVSFVHLTDGSTFIHLNQDREAYICLSYFGKGMRDNMEQMEKAGIPVLRKGEKHGVYSTVFLSPDNFQIALVDMEMGEMQKRTTLMDYAPEAWNQIEEYPNKNCGIFGELCMQVRDLDVSVRFWESLGFVVNKPGGGYPWAIAHDGLSIIGLHQTKDFDGAAITYFAKDMGEKIKALKAAGVDGMEVFQGTGGNESNVVLTTPENQKFFLFSY